MLLRQIILARQAVTAPDSETTGLTRRCVFDVPDSQPDNKKREQRLSTAESKKERIEDYGDYDSDSWCGDCNRSCCEQLHHLDVLNCKLEKLSVTGCKLLGNIDNATGSIPQNKNSQFFIF